MILNKIKELLEYNGQNELKKTLEDDVLSYASLWDQCNQMTRLGNYQALRNKITLLTNQTWFYIGYTNQHLSSHYLWRKTPDNARFNKAKAENNLVKSHTYYTHLGGIDGENEKSLINEFKPKNACLNSNNYGEITGEGIVYVLVYTPEQNNQ